MAAIEPRTPSRPGRQGRRIAGRTIAIGVALLIAALLAALALAGQRFQTTGSAAIDLAHLLRMSAIQAGLSTLLSLIAGVLLAWSLDRQRFTGRAFVVGLLSTALVLPSLVVISGLIAIWGRNGWINFILNPLGMSSGSAIFGLGGILAAHVLLNGALAARVFLDRLEAIPPEKLKLGRSLGLSPLRRFLIIDLPALAGSVPGVGATIFLLCFTSFPIVLVLGGGPANQTLEVAIYESVRFDFDLGRAVMLALVQLVACAAIIIPATRFSPVSALFGRRSLIHWPDGGMALVAQRAVLIVLLVLFIFPLAAVLARGFGPSLLSVLQQPAFWNAFATSMILGSLSAVLAVALALTLGMSRALETARSPARTLLGLPVFAYLAVPAVVLALGFFLLARMLSVPTGAAAPVVLVLANALLALPFAFAILSPPLEALARRHEKIIRSLGLSGLDQWTRIEWPLLGRAAGYALAVSFVFSLGDLGVISLFGTAEFSTLPWFMYRAFGAYRTQDAEAIAAILLILSLVAFLAIPKLIEILTNARNR
jgi:thiamine transport system permease protein